MLAVLLSAEREMVKDKVTQIEPGHLLLGLLLEKEGIAAKVLESHGVELDNSRVRIEGIPGLQMAIKKLDEISGNSDVLESTKTQIREIQDTLSRHIDQKRYGHN